MPRIDFECLCIGVEMSQAQRPGAICVAEIQSRGSSARHHRHWVVRHIERLPAGMRLPAFTQRLQEVVSQAYRLANYISQVVVNSTGLGAPVVEWLASQIDEALFYTIYMNHGDRRLEEGKLPYSYTEIVSLGKAYLVSAVQAALQTERLHLPRSEDCNLLAEELLSFQIDIEPDANERYGSFRVGSRDEMVNALGLTVQPEPIPGSWLAAAFTREELDAVSLGPTISIL